MWPRRAEILDLCAYGSPRPSRASDHFDASPMVACRTSPVSARTCSKQDLSIRQLRHEPHRPRWSRNLFGGPAFPSSAPRRARLHHRGDRHPTRRQPEHGELPRQRPCRRWPRDPRHRESAALGAATLAKGCHRVRCGLSTWSRGRVGLQVGEVARCFARPACLDFARASTSSLLQSAGMPRVPRRAGSM